jgi:hypothetical protein
VKMYPAEKARVLAIDEVFRHCFHKAHKPEKQTAKKPSKAIPFQLPPGYTMEPPVKKNDG